ncbi:hypothetical protein HSBAA_59810 [Vreelandella sulfidaeris]|uniref:NADH:flavin oxidoreductase/NADH oxidase N-terminal domain-containing protein n=1 Tax=Vreelandella sulfidaeris TaxID=115553 RepID=A0A455UF05_9GAMM|nr:hypothetical protein HSBAA_59810 [Halomonas sulfidaeris]
MAYETLFTPTQLGSLSIPNRVIMAPLTRSRTPDSVPGKMQEAYYGQRAGAGLIISEATNISPTARGYVYTPGIWTDEQETGWKGLLMQYTPKVAVLPCNCGTLGEFLTKWFNLTANSR